jgi:hypothetical protein
MRLFATASSPSLGERSLHQDRVLNTAFTTLRAQPSTRYALRRLGMKIKPASLAVGLRAGV